MERIADPVMAYRLRWKRRRLLHRAFRKRRQLATVADRTGRIGPGDILAASTVRNEAIRLPYFLDHYRRLGVDHFLFVDNGSDDGTAAYLAQQPDVSLWSTPHSYKLSRFGLDWLTWLQMRHAHGHWCLTLDADEILVYPYHDTRPLPALTEWLERAGAESFGALMLDMYPKGPVRSQVYDAGRDPFEILCWFDSGNYTITRQEKHWNLWVQGGPRARLFFADRPRRAPTMNKVPLVRWHWRYVYVNSTHALLPRRLNLVYDEAGGEKTSGVLLHTKFLHTIVEKSAEEKRRREHFANSALYDSYYDSLMENPDLWDPQSTRLRSWRQLEAMGLMSRGGWI
ncbi:glycosyltransferase family 2 protein [Roseovarius salinarum]|uniref:glycosyltransferase family 2 protein n=1 Tax=Roseovarius salinarum TaxID=1981892 RepID=UPI000C335148|nr:glycosyltransferase family 2 protein [Roseovarius salinarum]